MLIQKLLALKITTCIFFFLLGPTLTGEAAVTSEAYVGEPFGVGRVTVDVLRGQPVLPLSDERFTVEEANGRALYPVLKQQPVRRLLQGLLQIETPRKVTIYYLFRGDQPFDLSAYTPYEQGVRVKPLRNATSHQKLLNEWWQQYTKYYEMLLKDRSYPPVVENYLIASLSRRLNLPIPKPRSGLFGVTNDQENSFNYLAVNEAHLLRIDRMLLLGQQNETAQLQPLPSSTKRPTAQLIDEKLNQVGVERIATHVPQECFYIRFGNFTNYLWFRDFNKQWQGDLGNMVLQRGIKNGAGDRIQQQLSLKESALAKVFGPQVIADAAIVGLDHHIAQGAAIGILFQAKNNFLLSADLNKQRRGALTKFAEAKETTVELEGKSISLIATPDGRVRSYYVQQEDFHLVTTSRTLAQRFLQAGQGDRSLATLDSFRRARLELPLEREDTMFAFVSEKYWENLCSPHYFIENMRRVRSSREPLLLELARYTAVCEGNASESTGEFIANGILPAGFGIRADGSELQIVENTFVDSLRGARGYFLPIADMLVGKVTTEEVTVFQQFTQKLQKSLGQLPPTTAAIKRMSEQGKKQETIRIEVVAQGALRQSLGKFGALLGQPTQQKLRQVTGDLLSVETVLEFPSPIDGEASQHHVFGALRDFRSPLVVQRGVVLPNSQMSELVRGYLGAWPKPGFLNFLTGGEEARGADPEQVGNNLWQAKQDDFLLISFKPEVVREVLPQLDLQPAERAAQVRFRLADLTNTLMAENANTLGYMQTRKTSASGSRLMNSLANQLRVPRPECRKLAERLVDGEFVCALGGEYQLYAPGRGLEVWASSALPEENRFLLTKMPEDFQLPLLTWFRGLQGDLSVGEEALRAYFEIKMAQAALP